MVHIFYELPDLTFTVEGLEIKMIAPVAKITRNDENCVLIIEIRRQDLTHFIELLFSEISHNDRHNFGLAQCLSDVGHMHL